METGGCSSPSWVVDRALGCCFRALHHAATEVFLSLPPSVPVPSSSTYYTLVLHLYYNHRAWLHLSLEPAHHHLISTYLLLPLGILDKMSARSLLSLAAVATTASAFQGFNYGAAFSNGALKQEADFEAEFTTAANLEGTNGAFNSARLFTMIQGDTPNDPISAIPAAISTKTSLLFGLWASAGDEAFSNEIAALQKTIDQYCDQLDGLVAGISVGSEDLYRNSPTAIRNGENPGTNPDVLVRYIERVRDTIQGTCLSDIGIGHVDTWTAYDNSSNSAVVDALDWVGMDAYAYFEDTKPNAIENGASLFQAALDATERAAGGREVWITETGWPVSGEKFGDAIPSPENARQFYKEVGCPRFGNVNVWWYTFQDSAPETPNPSFGVIGSELTETPLYDLSCDGSGSDPEPSQSKSKTETKTGSSVPEPTETLPTTPIEDPIRTVDPSRLEPAPIPTVDPSRLEPAPIPTGSYCNTTFSTPSQTVVVPEPLPTTEDGGSPPPPEETGGDEQPQPSPEPEPSTPGEQPQPQPTTPGEEPQPEPQPTDDQGGEAPSEVPEALAMDMKANSLGAAVVAVVIAAGLL